MNLYMRLLHRELAQRVEGPEIRYNMDFKTIPDRAASPQPHAL